MTDQRIQTISRGLIGAQQLEFGLRQKSERDYVYEQLLPDARRALDSLAADLEAAREALEEIGAIEWVEEVDVNGEYVTERWRPSSVVKCEIDAALARLSAGKETT